jgi:hypothetical protein
MATHATRFETLDAGTRNDVSGCCNLLLVLAVVLVLCIWGIAPSVALWQCILVFVSSSLHLAIHPATAIRCMRTWSSWALLAVDVP